MLHRAVELARVIGQVPYAFIRVENNYACAWLA
jgi:hypothetical protein